MVLRWLIWTQFPTEVRLTVKHHKILLSSLKYNNIKTLFISCVYQDGIFLS